MTDVYVHGKKAVRMNVHQMGENYVWFEFILKDGTSIQTYPLKGEI